MSQLGRDLQVELKARGYNLGKTGSNRDGVDGVPGDLTFAAALAEIRKGDAPCAAGSVLTERAVLELASHEAIVQEAYLDSVGVWTWALGVTNRSGHVVHPRYKDNPQPIRRCLEVSIWLMQTRYLPAVLAAFDGHALTEAQLAAALSFHYNTGAIARASWVDLFLDGQIAVARERFMDWDKPAEIRPRREAERDLFFDGVWSNDGKVTVWPVKKPSYRPDWRGGRRIDITADVAAILGGVS